MKSKLKQMNLKTLKLLFLLTITANSVSATTVFTIDESTSNKAKEWSYVAKESGHYQVGQAWLEVLSEGTVELLVTAGNKVIREEQVVRNTEVHRFECRIDELASGETIKVSVKPSPGTKYRIGYMIAFATPTFHGAEVFEVSDFGAIGDGKSDDMAAIHAAGDAGNRCPRKIY